MPHTPTQLRPTEADRLLSVTTVPDPRPGRVVVEVVGEVDSCTAPALDLVLISQTNRPELRELVVFLGRVSFLGAAGIRVLAKADRRCRMRGVRLVIRTGGRPVVLRPLQLTGLVDRIAVDPEDGALTRPRDPRTSRRRRTSSGPRCVVLSGCADE